jgi:hypothetical protein
MAEFFCVTCSPEASVVELRLEAPLPAQIRPLLKPLVPPKTDIVAGALLTVEIVPLRMRILPFDSQR